jgi:hypothetical protein
MNERSASLRSALTLALLATGIGAALAAEDEAKPPPLPGLPAGLDWSFNFDATWGVSASRTRSTRIRSLRSRPAI